MNRSRASFSALPALACLLFGLLADKVAAQEVNVPATKNPHIRKVAWLYEDLEYEAALQLIFKAEQYSGNTAQEKLWLELMKGVLHYSLREASKSDAAFRRAFKQSPYTSLPLLTPSQTLYEHFNALRRESAPVPMPQAAPSPQSPAASQPQPDASDGISEAELQEKLTALEEQGRDWPGGAMPPKLASALETLRQQVRQARTAQERKTIATTIDLWADLLNRQATKSTLPPSSSGALTTATPEPEKRPQSQAAQAKPPTTKPVTPPNLAASPAPSPATSANSPSQPSKSTNREALLNRVAIYETQLRHEHPPELTNLDTAQRNGLAMTQLKTIRQRIATSITATQRMNEAVSLDKWAKRFLTRPPEEPASVDVAPSSTIATAPLPQPPSSIARNVLLKRITDNEARLRQMNVATAVPAWVQLKELGQRTRSALTPQQRMNVALDLDRWERRVFSNP